MLIHKNENNNSPLPKIREFDGHDWYLTKIYRRNLPHWELNGSTYFITTRVRAEVGKPFLNPTLARLMIAILHREDEKSYDLQAFVIMPDHLHIIIKPFPGKKLQEIMKELKGSSGFQINKALNRMGKFWQSENFDHLIRDGVGLREKWDYIRENPVKAKLVENGEDYAYSSFYKYKAGLTCGLKPAKTSTG